MGETVEENVEKVAESVTDAADKLTHSVEQQNEETIDILEKTEEPQENNDFNCEETRKADCESHESQQNIEQITEPLLQNESSEAEKSESDNESVTLITTKVDNKVTV